jgi:hypothetical protein
MLIAHPDAHRAPTSHVQVLELVGELLLKPGRLGRVLLGVGLARHLQDPAQFSQPVIHATELERHLVFLRQPMLNLLGALPAPGLQSRLEFLQQFASDLWFRPPFVFPVQQAGHAPGFEGADPIEELTAAATDLGRDLGGGELAAGGHAQGQQARMVFDVLAGHQRFGDSGGQVGSFEVKAFRHE